MDLKSGHLFWPSENRHERRYPRPRHNLSCDIAIIGGGITGALVAHHLTAAGLDAVLLDKRTVAHGSTSASTALLLYEIDTHLGPLIERVGEDHAVRGYTLGIRAIDELESITRSLGDACGFERKQSLYLASNEEDAEEIRREYGLRRRYGMKLDLLSSADLEARFPFRRPAALLTHAAAQVDPYRLTHRLLANAHERGFRVYEQTEVIGYERGDVETTLITSGGTRVRARRVVFATGYESRQYLREPVTNLWSTYALASEPIDCFRGWEDRCLIWEAARPYLYLRTTEDGRAVIGGGDEKFIDPDRRDALIPEKCRFLRGRFRELFPDIAFEPTYAWAGIFGGTDDGLPYIGETGEFPGACFVLGYGGNGITFSVIAAEIIRDLCLGRENPDAEIFRFGR